MLTTVNSRIQVINNRNYATLLPFYSLRRNLCVCTRQACWVINSFSEMKFKNVENLKTAVDSIRALLSNDKELPVRVEAATAIQMLLTEQEKGMTDLQNLAYNLLLYF
jgi:hypothetical protein